MPLTKATIYLARCDGPADKGWKFFVCDQRIGPHLSEEEVQAAAVFEGWVCEGENYRCPRCGKRKEEAA